MSRARSAMTSIAAAGIIAAAIFLQPASGWSVTYFDNDVCSLSGAFTQVSYVGPHDQTFGEAVQTVIGATIEDGICVTYTDQSPNPVPCLGPMSPRPRALYMGTETSCILASGNDPDSSKNINAWPGQLYAFQCMTLGDALSDDVLDPVFRCYYQNGTLLYPPGGSRSFEEEIQG